LKLAVKVVPGAATDAIAGWLGDALKVRVSAPPERGKANRAVEALLSGALGVEVRLLEGERSSRKLFSVPGLDEAQIRSRVEGWGKQRAR
jgi:uncharacterized protein